MKIDLAGLRSRAEEGRFLYDPDTVIALIEAVEAAKAFIHLRNDLNWQDAHPSEEEVMAITQEEDELIDAMHTTLSPFTEAGFRRRMC